MTKSKITDFFYLLHMIGLALLIIGILHPLEGSLLVAVGSLLLSASKYLHKDSQTKHFIWLTILICSGVLTMVLLSALGGIGGNSSLPIWLALFILPYPLGWLLTIKLLIKRAMQNPKRKSWS
jgi:hypothetical protein